MLTYYVIPLHYETLLASYANEWNSNLEQYTIITGIYQPSEILNDENTTVINKNILQEFEIIKKGYKNEEGNIFELKAFCFKADLTFTNPALEIIIENYRDILAFHNVEDYLEFINNL